MPRSMRMATLPTNLWATKPTFGCTKQLRGFGRYDYKNGYYQGPKEAPLDAASGCPGVYGKGSYPGYAGDLLIDSATGASYNAHGVNGRKYLLPALFDPSTSTGASLV